MYLNTLNRYFYTFSKMLSFSSIKDCISKANIHVIEIECKIIKYNINNIFCALSISNKHIFNDFSIDTLSLFFSLFCLSAICLPLKYITTNEWIQMHAGTVIPFICFVQNSNRSYSLHGGFLIIYMCALDEQTKT